MKHTRFFHMRPDLHNGGTCVAVTGDPDNLKAGVEVRVALCHTFRKDDRLRPGKDRKGDAYNKKEGRSRASVAPVEVVPLRYLPARLGALYKRELLRVGQDDKLYYVPDFSFGMKYFLPKE